MSKTRVVLLGTGTPALISGRYQSSLAVIVNDDPYIVDCGSGCLQRIIEAKVNGIDALAFEKLNKLFLTHFHPDHTVGLPGFLIGPWVRDRKSVTVYGPAGTEDLIHGILHSYKKGIDEHLHHGPKELDPMGVATVEFDEGIIYQDQQVRVEAIRVNHGTFDAFGFIFYTPDKTIVISGDTGPGSDLYQKAINCDLLIHEVYSEAEINQFPKKFRDYFKRVHTSSSELGRIAVEVNPGTLVLTHQIHYSKTKTELLEEIQSHFKGHIVYGNDLDVFE